MVDWGWAGVVSEQVSMPWGFCGMADGPSVGWGVLPWACAATDCAQEALGVTVIAYV